MNKIINHYIHYNIAKKINKSALNFIIINYFQGLKVLRDGLGIVEENVVPITFKKTRKDFMGREENEGKYSFYFIDGEDRPRRGGRGRGGRGGRGLGRGGRRTEE